MDGTLCDIVMYKIDNNEPLEIQSWNGVCYSLVPIPSDVDPKDYDKKAKRTKWIEDMLEKSVAKAHRGLGPLWNRQNLARPWYIQSCLSWR